MASKLCSSIPASWREVTEDELRVLDADTFGFRVLDNMSHRYMTYKLWQGQGYYVLSNDKTLLWQLCQQKLTPLTEAS